MYNLNIKYKTRGEFDKTSLAGDPVPTSMSLRRVDSLLHHAFSYIVQQKHRFTSLGPDIVVQTHRITGSGRAEVGGTISARQVSLRHGLLGHSNTLVLRSVI